VAIRRVEAAAVEERWSGVPHKGPPRGWWPARAPLPGVVLACPGGSRADEGGGEVQTLLQPFGLAPCDPEAAGVDERPLPASAHPVGTRDLQQSERKPLTLRTRRKRLARNTICFSPSVFRHDPGIGLFVNRDEFGTPV
jgi:insertion element IS1 protein InsB